MVDHADSVYDAIVEAKDALHAQYIACSQVDWVGYCIGGLLPRVYYRKATDGLCAMGFYYRHDNMMRGDFHKLITVGTPHFGTPLANLLVAIRSVAVVWAGSLQPALTTPDILDILRWAGLGIDGAIVDDLQERSLALASIGQTKIPCHAIVGTGGEAALAQLSIAAGLATLAGPYGETLSKVIKFLARNVSLYALFRNTPHDLVVLGLSQRGGLSQANSSEFGGWESLHPVNIASVAMRDRVVALLRAPVGTGGPYDLFAQHFPSPTSGFGLLSLPDFSNLLTPLAQANSSTYTVPTMPVRPGELVTIPMSNVPVPFISQIDSLIDSAGHVMPASRYGNNLMFSVPSNAMGPTTIRHLRESATTDAMSISPPLALLVVPWSSTNANIDSPTGVVELTGPGQERTPSWFGQESGGTTVDLTGLVVLASSNPSVAAIVANNRIRAVAEGDVTVTASWLDATATIPVHVHFHSVVPFRGESGTTVGAQLTLSASGGPAALGNSAFHLDLSWTGPRVDTYLAIGPRVVEQAVGGLTLLVPPAECLVLPFPAAAAQAIGSACILHIPTPIPNVPALAGHMLFLQAARMVPGAWLAESGGLRLFILP